MHFELLLSHPFLYPDLFLNMNDNIFPLIGGKLICLLICYLSRVSRQKKTMKLSRALSDLVKYTKSVGIHDVETESKFNETFGENNCCTKKWKGLCS